jgi:hypothetical protein
MRKAGGVEETTYLIPGEVSLSGPGLGRSFDVRGMAGQSVFIGPDENHPKMSELGV